MINAADDLNLEEVGALNRLIDRTYDRAAWPRDEVRPIMHWLGISARKWRSLRSQLIQKGVLVERDGCLIIPAIEADFEEFLEKKQACYENASKGGLKSAQKRKKPNDNNEYHSTEGEGDGEQESETDSPPSYGEFFRKKLVRHLKSKPKKPGKELREWVWRDGPQILMVTDGLNKKDARSRIARLLNTHDENAATVAQILTRTVQKIFEHPDQATDVIMSDVLINPPGSEAPVEWSLIVGSDAGKKFDQEYRQENGRAPKQVDGSYRVDRKTFSDLFEKTQRRRV